MVNRELAATSDSLTQHQCSRCGQWHAPDQYLPSERHWPSRRCHACLARYQRERKIPPEVRARKNARRRERRANDAERRARVNARQSARQRKRWTSDPEYRARDKTRQQVRQADPNCRLHDNARRRVWNAKRKRENEKKLAVILAEISAGLECGGCGEKHAPDQFPPSHRVHVWRRCRACMQKRQSEYRRDPVKRPHLLARGREYRRAYEQLPEVKAHKQARIAAASAKPSLWCGHCGRWRPPPLFAHSIRHRPSRRCRTCTNAYARERRATAKVRYIRHGLTRSEQRDLAQVAGIALRRKGVPAARRPRRCRKCRQALGAPDFATRRFYPGKLWCDKCYSDAGKQLEAALQTRPVTGYKQCQKCQRKLPREAFYPGKRTHDHLMRYCALCVHQRSLHNRPEGIPAT